LLKIAKTGKSMKKCYGAHIVMKIPLANALAILYF
jgi:hypothetical protein